MRSVKSFILSAFIIVAIAGCNFPNDPEGTLASVRNATLDAGVASPELADEDRAALEAIARGAGAELVLHQGNVHDLAAQIEAGQIDILAGCIPEDTPLAEQVALTNPFGNVKVGDATHKRVLAIRKGENAFLIFINKALKEVSE